MDSEVGRSRFLGVVVAVGALLLASPPVLAGQAAATPDPAFSRLQEKLREGDKVIVTDQQGRSTKGRLTSVSAEEIVLTVDGAPRQFPADTVTRVKRQRTGVLLGALIGLGAGIAAAIPLYQLQENEGTYTGVVFGVIALGVGSGIGIDALVNIPRTVYKREPNNLALTPLVGPKHAGARLTVSF
jgi:hypothetical protein